MPLNRETRERLVEYVKKHPGAYTDQIARKFGLAVFEVHDPLMKLAREGRVRPGRDKYSR